MSPLLISLLVVAGILLLILIAYLNHIIENNKIERARRKADISDRLRRCEVLSDTLPGQLMTPALKLLLTRLQLHYAQELQPLDKGNTQLPARIGELQALISQGEALPSKNPPTRVASEAIAKEVRFQLEGLQAQLVHAHHIGLVGAGEAKRWVQEVRQMAVQINIELFVNLGRAALQQNQAGQARLAFERGVQYISKQPDRDRYQRQLEVLKQQLERANALVLAHRATKDADQASELLEGLDTLDEDWKKKNIYD